MRDDGIYKSLNIIIDLLSDLYKIPRNNFKYKDGKLICLECGQDFYSHEHLISDCKSSKITQLHDIAILFNEG